MLASSVRSLDAIFPIPVQNKLFKYCGSSFVKAPPVPSLRWARCQMVVPVHTRPCWGNGAAYRHTCAICPMGAILNFTTAAAYISQLSLPFVRIGNTPVSKCNTLKIRGEIQNKTNPAVLCVRATSIHNHGTRIICPST